MSNKPKKVPNDGTGSCDGCGNDLKHFKWIMGESTGCSRKCAVLDHRQDNESSLAPGVDFNDRFGDES